MSVTANDRMLHVDRGFIRMLGFRLPVQELHELRVVQLLGNPFASMQIMSGCMTSC